MRRSRRGAKTLALRALNRPEADVQHRLKDAALDGTMAPLRRFVPSRDGYWDGYAYQIDPAFPRLAAEIATHRAGETHPENGH